MFRPLSSLVVLAACALPLAALAAPKYPFEGKWNCEVAEFTFTATTYNNGSETLKYRSVKKDGSAWMLTFPKNYQIGLSGVTANAMQWTSLASGDSFACKRVK